MAWAVGAYDVRRRYGDVVAVDGVTLEVGTGEMFGILGPNGAGKTTTLEIVEGLRRPDTGRVELFGVPSWPRNPDLLRRVGVQLQSSSFFERLTVREQVHTFAALYGVPRARAEEKLDLVGLTGKASARVENLSGGQAQRLSLACALVHDPELVFLDEPTAGLDPQARRNLWDVLREIHGSGRTVVLTTHYLDEAEALCDRVAIMDHGRILQLGPPAELVRGLAAPTRIGVESGLLPLDVARALPGVVEAVDDGVSLTLVTRTPARVLAALAERQSLAGLQVKGATLEDVFLQLTGREYRA